MKPSLVMLPGLLCDRANYAAQIAAFSPEYDCHVPHYGVIDSLPAMADHVLATAPAERFALMGHSMGGRVALEVYRKAPHRVDRLALLDTGFHPIEDGEHGEKEKAGRYALLKIAQEQGMRAMAKAWARGMVHPMRLDTPLFEEVLQMLERSNAEVFAAQIDALIARPDATPVLGEIRVPTLVLVGRQDNWSNLARHQQMHGLIPGSVLEIVEDCGHMSTMEQPEACNRAFEAWLASTL